MIIIVDYGMGNLGSVLNMFKKVGAVARISSDIREIHEATKILLPGVGAFDTAMRNIDGFGLREVLNQKALIEKVPILGICLGMQLLTLGSEEGKLPGLGWINGMTFRFKGKIDPGFKIPHMGWNRVFSKNEHPIISELGNDARFYFVHSYYVLVDNPVNSLLKTEYGVPFDSAIVKENIFGAQFHPEKSHKFGMKLFQNFSNL